MIIVNELSRMVVGILNIHFLNLDLTEHIIHYDMVYAIQCVLGWNLKPGSQPHAQFFDRTIFSLIPIFWNRIRFY